ncbi:GNAT family N-acetyltransferase [Mycoplasmatota bacterium]|nr:GNAT family N-acetyltransferase [Mycoplasmatota bacterium]
MKIKVYDTLTEYMNETFSFLAQYELQNNLIIGNCIRAKEYHQDTRNFFLATVKNENDDIKTIVMQTPPFPLLIFEVGNKACNEGLECLIDYLLQQKIDIPGIVTEKQLSKRFLDRYIKKTNISTKVNMNMRIYRLDKVQYRENDKGYLRKATMDDLYYIPYWNDAFAHECDIEIRTSDFLLRVDKFKKQIEFGYLYVYEDNIPVSMIAAGRKTLNGIILNNVYTPPHYRKKGYATNMVSDVCTQLLDDGYQFCGLFTDLKNPISNSIYQKVGFYPVCDYDEIAFIRK